MPQINIAGKDIEIDGEGFLVAADAWCAEYTQAVAQVHQISLTDRHWEVIDFCRKDYAETGTAPGVRRISKVAGIPTKELYSLFPGGPGKLAAKFSGLQKPAGCV